MNNSKIALDKVNLSLEEPTGNLEKLRETETKLVRIIEAISELNQITVWSTLKSLVFDGRIESIEKQVVSESLKQEIHDSELYRLQGRLYEARKYDLDRLLQDSRQELSKIRQLTQPTER